jgi:hypothetical protein
VTRSPRLPAPLRSAEIKFKRACFHEEACKRELIRFRDSHPAPTFRVEPEGDEKPSRLIGAVNRFHLVCTTAPPDLPDAFSAQVGDAIHNFRCVIDHIAWQLVIHGNRWPLKEERARHAVQFPTYHTESGFRKNRSRRLPGIDADALRFIKSRYNYTGGKATKDALLNLARLSNDDKHQQLRFFLNAFLSVEAGVWFEDCEVATWDPPLKRPRLQPGAIVVNFSYRVTGPNPKVKMNLAPTTHVVDEDWRDLFLMLQAIRTEVGEILYAPEIIAAVS